MASAARLDELKKKFDENPRRYFAPLANEHRKSGDLDQAIALCRTHLPQQPAHISGHIVLAQALFEAGSLDESREIFHTALGLDPENLIALRYLGDIARETADLSTARSWYQRVLEVDPRNDEIVQLVRELDMPQQAVVEEVAAPAEAPQPAAPAAEIRPASAPSAQMRETDERFAPISLENADFDAAIGEPAPAEPASAEAAPSLDASLDLDTAWNTEQQPTAELPMLDVPEIDPFDLNPAASAEALFDAHSEAPVDDIFATELADLSASDAGQIDAAFAAEDAWAPPPELEPEVHAQASEPAAEAFEEGAFYLEPAPEPAEPNELETVAEQPVAEQPFVEQPVAELIAIDAVAPAEPAIIPSVNASEPVAEVVAEAAAELATEIFPEPAETIDAFASAPTAEWQTPAHSQPAIESRTNDDLGLEVMEFVPPSSGSIEPDTSLVTSSAAEAPANESGAPAAFVTETMAELYLQQGFRNEALAVYRELLARNPADSSLRDRVVQIESGSMSSLGAAAVSEDVVESALRRQTAKPARSVRSFFGSLASRRAPFKAPADVDVHADAVSAFAPNDAEGFDSSVEQFAAPAIEASNEPGVEAGAPPEPVGAEHAAPERIMPLMSAAETLASYDPFADVDTAPSLEPEPTDALPNVDLPVLHVPVTPEPIAQEVAAPEPVVEAPRQDEPRSALDALFPETPVAPRTEAAAQTFATAFGRTEPQGRPTRAASSELSLDKVFRGSPEGTPPADGGFSFDQFFSDSRPAGSDVAAPTLSPPETGRSGGGAGDAHDIEQFTAWLEGLKKK